MGVFNLFLHVTLSQTFWPHDVPRAHAISGFWIGFGAFSHALMFGMLTEAVGVVNTLLVVSQLQWMI